MKKEFDNLIKSYNKMAMLSLVKSSIKNIQES
jgi:hypothetical protein